MTKHLLLNILCFIFILISPSFVTAQETKNLDTLWLNYYGGNRADGLQKIIETYDGKIVGVGHSKSASDFEKTGRKKKNSKDALSSGGNDDIFFLQINADGKEEYISVLGKTGKEAGHSVIQTYDGGFVIVGYSDAKTDKAIGGQDAWIIKLDQNKKHLWNKRLGSTADDAFIDVVQASNGDLIACGYKGNQAYVARFDWLGELLQEANLPKEKTKEWATSIITLQDGNIAVAGLKNGKKTESFFLKLSPQLSPIGAAYLYFERWFDRFGAEKVSIVELQNQQIAFVSPSDPEGDAILVGCAILNSNGAKAKATDGAPLIYHFPKENDSSPFDVLQATDGKIYITGATKAHNKSGSANKNKFFLTSIDSTLQNPQTDWVFYGGNFEDRAYTILQSHSGNLFLSGASNSQNAFWGGGENGCIVKTSPLDSPNIKTPAILRSKQTNLVETSADGLLEAEEIGYIEVTLENKSNTAIHNFQAKINSSTTAIEFPKSMFLGSFPPNSSKVVGIPLKGEKHLVDGTHDFTINFKGRNLVEFAPIAFTINSRKPSKSNLQIIANNFEQTKNIVPEEPVTLTVTLHNKGDKAAKYVNGIFNFKGGNVTVLSDKKQIKVGTIEPNESKEFEITFKVSTIDRGKIIEAKFTYSSDAQLAYDVQKVYPFQVATNIPMPSLVIAPEEWSIKTLSLPREQEIALQLKITNEGDAAAHDVQAVFEASEGIESLSETTISKEVFSIGSNWVLIYKFRVPIELEKNKGEIKLRLSSKGLSDKSLTFPILLEAISPPNLVLVDQNIIKKDKILMPGGTAALELEIKNTGGQPSQSSTFTFVVNKGLAAESNIQQTLPALQVNETKTVTFDFSVLSSYTEATSSINLTVEATQSNLQQDIPNTFPITISPLPQKKPAVLIAQYILDSPESVVMKGTSAIFKVQLKNTGELPATGVRVQLGLERGLTLRSDKIVTLNEIAAGETKSASFQFSVSEEFSGDKAMLTSTFYSKEKPYIGGKQWQYPATIIPPKNRPDPDYDIVMFWTYPGEAESTVDTIYQQLQLQASSKLPLEKEDFRIYVNDKWINQPGSKFGKVKLSNPNDTDKLNGRYDFKLETPIILDKTIKKNVIQVKVIKGKQTYVSKKRTLLYDRDPVNLHFVGIGISKYTELNSSMDDLEFAVRDVLDISDIFESQEGVLFSNVYCHISTNAKETRKNKIISNLQYLGSESYLNKINKNDVLIFYISSHGLAKGSEFKIMPSDYENITPDDPFLLDFERDILYHLNRISIKNKFVFVDACHSGAIDINVDNLSHSKSKDDKAVSDVLLNLMNKNLGFVPIVSCQAGEYSWEHADWQNGAFTEAFKEAFDNKSVTVKGGVKTTANGNVNDKKLSFLELYYFLQLRVPYIVQKKINTTQTPYMPKEILDRLRKKEADFPGSLDMFILK